MGKKEKQREKKKALEESGHEDKFVIVDSEALLMACFTLATSNDQSRTLAQ
jgi:hypothetical protein